MENKATFATIIASVFLLIYLVLINFEGPFTIIMAMFAISPLVLVLLAIAILKFGVYKGADLGDREWGYQDFEPEREEEYEGLLSGKRK